MKYEHPLEKEFNELFNQLVECRKELEKVSRKVDNDKTFTDELYKRESELIKKRFELKDLIEENRKKREEKGLIKVEV